MTSEPTRGDLVVLVADRDMDQALRGILAGPKSIGIRPIVCAIHSHPHHDGGCRTTAAELLRPFLRPFKNALVIFDREGCGTDQLSREEIETDVEQRLTQNGWSRR